MDGRRNQHWSRREFLGGLALAGSAGLIGLRPAPASADPPPETRTIRLIHDPKYVVLCFAPQYVAEELLRSEGFTDLRYVKLVSGSAVKALAAGQADMSAGFAGGFVTAVDAGSPIIVLTGLHGGCFELVAGPERIRTIRDLKGKKVLVDALGSGEHTLLSTMLAYIGLDPRKDVQWVTESSPPTAIRLLTEGKVDAIFAYPPLPQEMRAKKVGHVILKTLVDRPWSQYFCCMVGARQEFVRKYPAATKRALRAILKANQLCTFEAERSARLLVDKGYAPSYDYALQTLKDVPYATWRDYDPEATLRFHALLMRDAGMIKSTPQMIIARGTNWRFLNELKRELKA